MTRLQRFANSILDWYRGLEWGGKFIGTALRDWLIAGMVLFYTGVLRSFEMDYIPLLRDIIKRAEDTQEVPPELQPILNEIKSPTKQIGAFLGQAAGGAATGGIISSTLGPFLKVFEYGVSRFAEQFRFDAMTDLAIRFRRPDLWDEYKKDLADQGWTAGRIETLFDIAHMRLTEDLLVNLRARQVITPEQYQERMYLLGYGPEEADDYFKGREFYPTPADLVRWQAREVFEPTMIAKYGLDSEYEQIDKEPFYRAHMTDEQIINYWRAHWEHASWNQVQEMLFRGVITEAEVWDWFRLVEIPPFWRQKLIDTAYSPYTRVDVRRMHKIGVLTEADLVKAYMDLGYNRERAEKMKDFTVQYNQGTTVSGDRDLTKTDILRLYGERIITEADAESKLADLDFGPEEISYLLDLYTKETALKTRDLTLTQVKNLYQRGLRPKSQITPFLEKFGFDAQEIIAIYDLWEWEKPIEDKERDNHLSLSMVGNLYQRTVLNRAQASAFLVAMAYSTTEIGYIFDLWDYQKPIPIKLKERDLTVSQLKLLYQNGLRTKEELSPLLGAMGYDATETAAIFELWAWVKPAQVRLPTRAQLDSFLIEGIIDLQTWSDEYGALGYDLKYQEWYFALLVTKGKVEG